MTEYLNGYTLTIGVAILLALVALLMRAPKKKTATPLIVEDNPDDHYEAPEPIQKYSKFPEPRPLKTIETREAKDGIPWP